MSRTGHKRVLVVAASRTLCRVAVDTLVHAGVDVVGTDEPREAVKLARSHPPDVLVLDAAFHASELGPVADASRRARGDRPPATVLLEARPAEARQDLTRRLDVREQLGKPFGPAALLGAVSRALDPTLSQPSTTGHGVDDETLAERERAIAAREIAARVARVAAPALGDAVGADELAEAILAFTPPRDIVALGREMVERLPGEPGEPSLSGRVEHVPVGEVLQLLEHQRQSGVLAVREGTRLVEVCLRDGHVQQAFGQGVGRELRLGRYLLATGALSPAELEAVAGRDAGRRLLGEQLVRRGHLGRDDLTRALTQQSSELVYEALRFRHGAFRFTRFARRAIAEDAALALPVHALLMEGLQRVDEWALIREQIPSLDAIPMPDAALSGQDVSRFPEALARVAAAVDGRRRVSDIVDHTRLGAFDVSKALFDLVTMRLLHVVDPEA